jgi:asparagine synthase (glutamine-hydrolysing)
MLVRGLFMPWELDQVLPDEIATAGLERLQPHLQVTTAISPDPTASFARCQLMDMSCYMRIQLLRDTDWASMAHGLEVRVPLVDMELLRAVARHNAATPHNKPYGKIDLAAAPTRTLPEDIVNRVKTGFSTPISSWLPQIYDQKSAKSQRLENTSLVSHWSRQWAECVKEYF